MDIIDIMLARAMTPQGKTEAYVAKANKAAQKAAQAEEDAAAAVATVTAAADDIAAAQAAAAELLETAQQIQINTLDIEDVDAEVKKMVVNTATVDGANAKTLQVISTYPDNTLNTQNITKLYKSTGSNEDGTMTQKAITDALAAKATIQYVDQQIAQIPTGGGSGGSGATISFNPSDSGHLVTIDENGNLVASLATDNAVIEALLQAGTYVAQDAVGLDINYASRTYARVQEATNKQMGSDFDSYKMYGGRVKCNVADNGTINAFYGENGYTEDGTNGQVMIYQPKFYYRRLIRISEELLNGRAVRHETLIISPTEQPGFKLAPAFKGGLEYILLPAYDGSLANNKLASVAGALPLTNVTRDQAESYANARGEGWHIMTMAAESANQMLEMVEFGTMNGQMAIEQGITYTPAGASSNPCYFITGSTASLGNGTGHATSTDVSINGNISTMTEDGYRAICYRGMENPWGNLWSMIGGSVVAGNGAQGGGIVSVCPDFNYTTSAYESTGCALPSTNGWIDAMAYSNDSLDWVYIPSTVSNSASSLAPVGDGVWTLPNLNGTNIIATGGSYGFKEECGPFYYAADRTVETSARYNYGAKLLFVPTKNEIYTANITKWTTYMGG